MGNPITLDFSKAQPIPQSNTQSNQPVALDFSKAQPITPPESHGILGDAALGAARQVLETQFGLTPGMESEAEKQAKNLASGFQEGAAKTTTGLANLTASAVEKLLGKPAGSLQATGEFPKQPTIAGNVGEAGENVAEFMGGEEALKGLVALTGIPEQALALAEKYPKTFKILSGAAKGATIGGAQGAAKGAAEGKAAEGAKLGAEGGALGGAAAEAIPMAAKAVQGSKLGRAAINRSLDTATKDVQFGNPAVAIDREGIWKVNTGNWQAYRDAIRAGKTSEEAAQIAGGRFAAIYNRINELEPQLNQVLSKSPAKISAADAIQTPLLEQAQNVMDHFGLTDAEKDQFVTKIAELESDWNKRLAGRTTLSPLEANTIKQDVGDVVDNWNKNTAQMPPEAIQRIYVAVYESLKDAVNKAVPEASDLNNRVSDLLAAKRVVKKLAMEQETGRGTGVTAGTIGAGTWLGRLEAEAGRFLPFFSQGTQNAAPALRATLPPLAAGFTRVLLSNGAVASIPNENLERLQTRDPGLQVLESQPQQ